ncbi:hypothetical protein D3C78_1838120 [compost metagenome]
MACSSGTLKFINTPFAACSEKFALNCLLISPTTEDMAEDTMVAEASLTVKSILADTLPL